MSLDGLSTFSFSSSLFSNLSSKESERQIITPEMVDTLKKEKTQFINEKVKLRSKIVRMRELCSRRDQSIKKVLKESKDKQIIQTASNSTIQNLKKSIESLQNTKNVYINDLLAIQKKDSYWRASELESEIRTLYQEQIRLEEEVRMLCVESNTNREKLDYMYDVISSISDLQNKIEEKNEAIIELNKKLKTYRKGKQKNERNSIKNLSTEEIRKEIKDLDMQVSIEQLATKKSEDNCQIALNELDQIIQQMIEQIQTKTKF